ncbi:MAG: ABC transporter permease subunit [Kiritimatiellia bacterium]
MAILSAIGRKSLKMRVLLSGIYVVLLIGAATMVYPFLLMLAGTSKSGVDAADTAIVPAFLFDDLALYRKDVEGFFNESLRQAQNAFGILDPSFRHVTPPVLPNAGLVAEWECFVGSRAWPTYYYEAAYLETPVSRNSQPRTLRWIKRGLALRFGSVDAINHALGTDFVSMTYFRISARMFLSRMLTPTDTPFYAAYDRFKTQIPRSQVFFQSVETFYRTEFLQSQYSRDIENYNRAHGTQYGSWVEVPLPRTYPEADTISASERHDWRVFVRDILNLLWLRADIAATDGYRAYLKAKYLGNIQALNQLHNTAYTRFDEIPLPAVDAPPAVGAEMADWDAYVRGWEEPESQTMHQIAIQHLRIHGVDFLFQDHLKERYGTVADLNAALGSSYHAWRDILPPQRAYHYLRWFLPNRHQLRWEFLTRNFLAVTGFVLLQGRALFNTVVFCLLTILSALIVNPLAAYALSRYKPPSAYMVLLFVMVTMAFPPMVTQIPNFLLLRELGLLNTFAALVLPTMANGYSIFLLKGFFDSLPRELYESAEIDGAGELCIFWQITMSLSTPILAVIALNAFNAAYSNFMMALLVCQDQRMWTLMPWLYQLQMSSGHGVIFASLVIAAIPTFLIFIFCQNIIMRGIVVPVEK